MTVIKARLALSRIAGATEGIPGLFSLRGTCQQMGTRGEGDPARRHGLW